jgi:RNA polymerase sigma-70 factor (ECF subfamily)
VDIASAQHDEQELIRRIGEGDSEAFARLYADRAGRVRGYFQRCGFKSFDVDDLTQEVFLRAYRSIETFDPDRGRLATWLGAIARNLARSHWARRSTTEPFDSQLAEAMLADPDDPAGAPGRREEIDAVDDCIRRLPAMLALLVRLRYVEGRTTRGVAQAASMAESTVRARLKEAYSALERCLREKGVIK